MTSLLFSRLFEKFPFFSRLIPSRESLDVCQSLLQIQTDSGDFL